MIDMSQAVRSQLVIPMEHIDPFVADLTARHPVLYRSLGSSVVCPDEVGKNTYLDLARFCCGIGCSEMVSDALGHFFVGTLHSLGRSCRAILGHVLMAVVGSSRCSPRGWTGHDLVAGECYDQCSGVMLIPG
jgi:hypothetical protein